MLQYKPFNSNEPVYAPQRDVAFMFEPVAESIGKSLQSENLKTWLAQHTAANQLTEAELQTAVVKFLEGLRNFRDPAFTDVGGAMQASGFWDESEAARLAVLGALGVTLSSWYFKAVRDALALPTVGRPEILLATERTVEAIAAGQAYLNRDKQSLDELARAQEQVAAKDPAYAAQRERQQSGRLGW